MWDRQRKCMWKQSENRVGRVSNYVCVREGQRDCVCLSLCFQSVSESASVSVCVACVCTDLYVRISNLFETVLASRILDTGQELPLVFEEEPERVDLCAWCLKLIFLDARPLFGAIMEKKRKNFINFLELWVLLRYVTEGIIVVISAWLLLSSLSASSSNTWVFAQCGHQSLTEDNLKTVTARARSFLIRHRSLSASHATWQDTLSFFNSFTLPRRQNELSEDRDCLVIRTKASSILSWPKMSIQCKHWVSWLDGIQNKF